MKKLIKTALCTGLILFAVMTILGMILMRDSASNLRYKEFWDDPGKFDIWMMGTSHVYYTVQPLELYDKYGVTSYDIAEPAGHISQSYWTMMCALDKATPDMIVLDVYELHMDTKLSTERPKLHTNFDKIPMSTTKIKGLWDLTDGNILQFLDLMYPYYYRCRKIRATEWENILHPTYASAKGAKLRGNIKDISNKKLIPQDDVIEEENVSMQYLVKIIEECRARDIDLVLTAWPYYGHKANQRGLNSAKAIAEKYDVPLIDIRYDDLMDTRYNFKDMSHVNYSGAHKLTSLLGDYIHNHFELKDYHGTNTDTEKEWDKALKRYKNILKSRIQETTGLRIMLVWLSSDYFSADIYVGSTPDSTTQAMIDNVAKKKFITKEKAEEILGKSINYSDIVVIVRDENKDVIAHVISDKNK